MAKKPKKDTALHKAITMGSSQGILHRIQARKDFETAKAVASPIKIFKKDADGNMVETEVIEDIVFAPGQKRPPRGRRPKGNGEKRGRGHRSLL